MNRIALGIGYFLAGVIALGLASVVAVVAFVLCLVLLRMAGVA